MNKPTHEQQREFWELCGFRYIPEWKTCWQSPKGSNSYNLPQLSLHNLFKYAKDMFVKRGWSTSWFDLLSQWVTYMFNNQDKDPAIALFWAVYPILKEE